jgi:hypothetical protein
MAASLIQRGPMRSRRLHLRDFNLRSGAANLQRPPNKRLEKDLRPARSARWPRPLSLGVRRCSKMRVYWTLKSIRELADLSAKDRRTIWREAYREGPRYSFSEIALIALAAAVGATLGPLGAGLGVGIVAELLFSRIAERLRPRMMKIRERRGLGLPVSGAGA